MAQTFAQRGWQDREVKVRRLELLEVLRKNRAQHIQDYESACKGYRAAALERIEEIFSDLKAKINALKEGQALAVISLHFGLEVPVSHERAYDQVIRMMEMEVEDVVLLTAGQFACFCMDDWDWKDSWTASNSRYMRK